MRSHNLRSWESGKRQSDSTLFGVRWPGTALVNRNITASVDLYQCWPFRLDDCCVSAEDNKTLIRDYVAAFNRGDTAQLRRLFCGDALIWGVLGWGDLDKVVPIWQDLHDAYAIELQIESLIAENDVVAALYTERGKSVGSFRGGPVTGQSYELVAMEWFRIKDGRIHRRWGARDSATQLRQMGLPLA